MTGKKKIFGVLAVAAVAMSGSSARADDTPGFFSGMFTGIDVSFGGFLRTETTVSTTSEDNPANQLGNVFNGVS